MTKFRPILFNTEMVQAVLEGRKTQTRRIIKPKPEPLEVLIKETNKTRIIEGKFTLCKCPFGEIGDVLWVRETWFSTRFDCKELLSIGYNSHIKYKADNNYDPVKDCVGRSWKPSIHMPKEAARIFLKIKDIRVERLHNISEVDAIAEGIYSDFNPIKEKNMFRDYLYSTDRGIASKSSFFESPVNSFFSLWNFTYGENSFLQNPWVWVIEFERIEKPVEFN